MAKIPFIHNYDFEYAKLEEITPMIRRVTAENPGAFSFKGTGTYIIGRGKVAVIDPGPLIDAHIEALKNSLKGEQVTHILITHTHMDHSPAAKELKEFWQCKTYGYGPHGAGKIASGVPIEAGGDMDFVPDVVSQHGDIIQGEGWTVECVYTPGHTSNHLCFALKEEKALFTGDHIMGWSTTIVGPPDGDMTQYRDSLDILLERDDEIYWPTHGTCIKDVKTYVQAYIDHRQEREQQIIDCLRDGVGIIEDMVPIMYVGVGEHLYPAAGRSVLAAMERLIATGAAKSTDKNPDIASLYTIATIA